MKKLTYMLAGFLALSLSQSALAGDGDITVNGEVIDETCEINNNGQGNDFTVELVTVNSFELDAAGQTFGATPFVMVLSNCPESAKTVTAWFEETNVDQETGNLVNNAILPARNVQVELLTRTGDPIDLSTNTLKEDSSALPEETISAAGSAQLLYYARYIAVDGPASAGDVLTKATYSLAYN